MLQVPGEQGQGRGHVAAGDEVADAVVRAGAEAEVRQALGGDVEAGALVDEDWLLALERKAFVDLLGSSKTQERIMGMLQTGKPVRN